MLTIGGVTLQVDLLDAAPKSGGSLPCPNRQPVTPPRSTALPVAEDDFEMELEEDEEEFELATRRAGSHRHHPSMTTNRLQVSRPKPQSRRPRCKIRWTNPKGPAEPADVAEPAAKPQSADEKDAVAQFLMDLKLDEDD